MLGVPMKPEVAETPQAAAPSRGELISQVWSQLATAVADVATGVGCSVVRADMAVKVRVAVGR